jgi:CRISPR-associated protein Csd2
MSEAIQNRYEFVYLFDVENGNPNGDPDAGNMPRIDPETGHGIVTDVCLKRKIRNYVDLVKDNTAPYEIHVREGNFLTINHARAHAALEDETESQEIPEPVRSELEEKKDKLPDGLELVTFGERAALSIVLGGDLTDRVKKADKLKVSQLAKSYIKMLLHDIKEKAAKRWMCGNFFDVRTFGAVMATGDEKCGQVRGPVQMAFARSIDPILTVDNALFRTAAVNVDKPDDKGLGARKSTIPYALYRAEGYVSAALAEQTGFTQDDLDLLWQSLINMFEHDHSAARGKMSARKLFVFKHDSKLGNAPAHKLFELIKVTGGGADEPVRSFDRYAVTADKASLPSGVELLELL